MQMLHSLSLQCRNTASAWTVPLHDGVYHARHLLGQPQADSGLLYFMATASLMY